MWSCGENSSGKLCLGHQENQITLQKTSFSNIAKISAGWDHSIFQNNKGEIFSCGNNCYGQCGLGHFDDQEGNVFSVGGNEYGELGLGHNTDQNELNKISNIPPIKTISCAGSSCYLIDFEGNLWSFGRNDSGQLGHGDQTRINSPKIINTVKDIRQISYSSSGEHFLAKNSQNQIFVAGNNHYGQLGTGDTQSVTIPKEINSQYSSIWRDEFYTRAKSARK